MRRCLEIFNGELDRALALVGRPTLAELDGEVVRVPADWSAGG